MCICAGGAFFVPLFNILLEFSELRAPAPPMWFLVNLYACLQCMPPTRPNLAGLPRTGVKSATALSQAVIAGGAIAGVAVTLHKKHPYDPNATLIDFDLALMLLPVLLLGVSLGKPTSCLPHAPQAHPPQCWHTMSWCVWNTAVPVHLVHGACEEAGRRLCQLAWR